MRVGIVGDLHEPFTHPMYRRFCLDTFARWKVDEVVFIGDIVDQHAIGFWETDPDGLSAGDEGYRARVGVRKWKRSFAGKRRVCIGNHDDRQFRVAMKAGLPKMYLRDYAEVWGTPDWKWDLSHTIDGVLYEHGTGSSGKDAAINRAIQKRTSLVMGHVHSWAGVKWHTNDYNAIFGLNVGCGIDLKAYAFAYGKPFPIRPVLGCGIVIDGEFAYFESMKMGRREKYHRRHAA